MPLIVSFRAWLTMQLTECWVLSAVSITLVPSHNSLCYNWMHMIQFICTNLDDSKWRKVIVRHAGESAPSASWFGIVSSSGGLGSLSFLSLPQESRPYNKGLSLALGCCPVSGSGKGGPMSSTTLSTLEALNDTQKVHISNI